ncbi:glycerol dehydratase reactivase beta/small subunit family protein [Robertmurraya sp. FSL W8-0741]|uniref:glycerol dehydratase reactivase beta/small subunit family protein n=1 Tax=Robertmurraya TaxID=2837507 RepID=UPI000BA79654|nr:glycerol dehydratase reactivase beta/small subunit family protein [Robertmurraya siralis]PAE21520.1 dehydratase medium subunit [Bacillus sp. 7504-2]
MKINDGNEIQAIHVYYHAELNDPSLFRTLLYGIEEEGIPTFVKESKQQSALQLSHEAALDSTLGVGIGISQNGKVILHYTKLDKNQPLFEVNLRDPNKLRILGANAARLVKGIPFKSFEIEEEKELEHVELVGEALTKEDIAKIVAIVVKRLLESK